MKWRSSVVAVAVAIFPGVVWAASAPMGGDLVSHRATYDMALYTTKLGAGVTGASGKMTYKFADACDGWITENRTVLTFVYSEGDPVATSWELTSWESKDGLNYRFRVRSMRDGVVAEEIEGSAKLDGRNKGGVAHFRLPEVKSLKLPRGTLFPTEHTVRLLESARHGEKLLQRILFDGTGEDEPFLVNAMIGRTAPANTNLSPASARRAVNSALLTAPSWPVHMAFFPMGAADPIPDYEVMVRYYLNGVADELIQSYGTFSIKGTLLKLEALPKPDC